MPRLVQPTWNGTELTLQLDTNGGCVHFQGGSGRHRSLLVPLIDHVPWESSFLEVKTQGQLVVGLPGIKTGFCTLPHKEPAGPQIPQYL